MTQNAFFYEGRYYLLPDDCASVDELNGKHRDGQPFTVTELVEKKCMAPYFVTEYTAFRRLKLKKRAAQSPVFPVDVELMTMSAYNQRLREIIPGRCAKCPNFGAIDETDESLEGHHEEISLDGVCFTCGAVKDKTGEYLFIDRYLRHNIKKFASLGLETLLDEGKNDEAADLFVSEIVENIMYPAPLCVFADKQTDGRYRLIFGSAPNDTGAILMSTLFRELSKKYKKTWDFVRGIPEGYLRPEAVKPHGVAAEFTDGLRRYVRLTVYASPAPDDGAAEYAAFLWLMGTYGQRLLDRTCLTISICEWAEDTVLPEDTGLMQADDPAFLDLLHEIDADYGKEDEDVYPVLKFLLSGPADLPDDADEETVLAAAVITAFRDLLIVDHMAVPVHFGDQPLPVWTDSGDVLSVMKLPVARFTFRAAPESFPAPPADIENAFNRFTRFVTEKHLAVMVTSQVFCGGIEYWLLVLNLQDFMYAVRRFAPIFDANPADLYVFTSSGKNGGHFKPGFAMKRVETESKMRKKLKSSED
ncbi:MAG: hypothetical protein MJ192_02545 [Clostridia bacterium]|nr:hypothetical protein [Clostridia bacterium]